MIMFAGINVHAQTTEFTYQGQLQSSSAPANGNHDFEFALFDSLSGGSQLGSTITLTNIAVADGVFAVQLNFGSEFPGANRFLEIHVRQSGGGAFTPLTPRQSVTSAPYSVKSLNADNATSAAMAANATQLGGIAANQYVLTGDTRLTDARDPRPNSANYIQNQNAAPQTTSNFDISGTGKANIFNATTQFNIGGNRVLTAPVTSNIFAGVNAGNLTMTGTFNSFFGLSAGDSNTTGNNNAFFGQNAGQANTQGGSNAFFGETSGFLTTTGFGNSFFGASAGLNNTLGNDNVIVGRDAGLSNTTGSNNTIIGNNANVGANNLTFATAIGSGATVSASSTVVLGRAADTVQVPGIINSATQYNIGGSRVLSIAGTENLFTGAGAGTANTTGTFNSFFGANTGQNNTEGASNSFFGARAGRNNTTGGSNLFLGGDAGVLNTMGNSNVFVGQSSGFNNSTGSGNSFVGINSGFNNTGGSNSFFGLNAGSSNTTGSSNTIIGSFANVGSGALTFATAIGAGAVVNTNSTVVLGRGADTVQVPGNFTVTSASGDASVILPNNAISAAETLDEPGVASANASGQVALNGSVQILLSHTLTAPAPGFVLVIGNLRSSVNHANGTSSTAHFSVSDAPLLIENQTVLHALPSSAATGSYLAPITVHGLFAVSSAGIHDFFLLGQELVGNFDVNDLQLTLLFVPTSYGTVSLTRPEGPSGQAVLNVQTTSELSSIGPAMTFNTRREENMPMLEQLKRQQAEIDALKKLVCISHPQAEVCKEK